MADFTIQHESIALDACCVINLYASGIMEQALQALPVQAMLVDEVKNDEVGYVLDTADTGEPVKLPIDLEPVIQQGLLTIVSITSEAEAEMVVNLAALSLGDGEAITSAIAIHRNWALATDDKLAARVVQEIAPQLQILTTPDLMKVWYDAVAPSRAVVSSALINIETRGRFAPSSKHPLYTWWRQYNH